jgi:hypothetical protein
VTISENSLCDMHRKQFKNAGKNSCLSSPLYLAKQELIDEFFDLMKVKLELQKCKPLSTDSSSNGSVRE